MTDYLRGGTDYSYHREPAQGACLFRCPVLSCDKTSYGEQATQCPEHPYREMVHDR